jgi:hypothetical protein
MDIFQRLNIERGITIVLVTHEADIAEYATRVVAFPRWRGAERWSGGASSQCGSRACADAQRRGRRCAVGVEAGICRSG